MDFTCIVLLERGLLVRGAVTLGWRSQYLKVIARAAEMEKAAKHPMITVPSVSRTSCATKTRSDKADERGCLHSKSLVTGRSLVAFPLRQNCAASHLGLRGFASAGSPFNGAELQMVTPFTRPRGQGRRAEGPSPQARAHVLVRQPAFARTISHLDAKARSPARRMPHQDEAQRDDDLFGRLVDDVTKSFLRVASGTFELSLKLVDRSFGLHLLVADGLANGFFDGTFCLVGGASNLVLVHCDLLGWLTRYHSGTHAHRECSTTKGRNVL